MLSQIYRQQLEAVYDAVGVKQRQAIERCRAALKQNQRDPALYVQLAKSHRTLGEPEAMLEVLREGIERCPPHVPLHRGYITTLEWLNRTQDAIAATEQALRWYPDDWWFRLRDALLLPLVYQSREEIDFYRRRLSSRLAALVNDLSLETAAARQDALEAVADHTTFYLAYQGYNDVHLQQLYGQLVHRVVSANYPDWASPVPMPPTGGKLRVGYASAHFWHHSVGKMYLRWLQEHDRTRFEVHAYHVGDRTDHVTNDVRRASTKFGHFPDSWQEAARAMRGDNLHVLVFLDIGMHPAMTLLAGLRLAPVQCMAWGHSVTSGLPTVSYFLSSALMEPSDGPEHYSERLIRLPGIGICYRKPPIPRALMGRTRRDYGLGQDRIVYLSSQSVFKYLPEHDDVFPALARRVPQAQFAFVMLNPGVAATFRARLDRAFAAVGLAAADFCVLLPQQGLVDYWNLNLLADVYLDTLEWSGCNTALEALACGLPLVTLPGKFLRGRHTYAFLQQLGVTEGIARDKEGYLDIAVRLGTDRAWRQHLVQRLQENQHRIYADMSPLEAVEDLYEHVVRADGKST